MLFCTGDKNQIKQGDRIGVKAMTIPSWVKPSAWGVVLGALAWWAVLGFGLGWMGPGTAKSLADNQVQAAVVAASTPYCVSRFERQPSALASWQALKKSAGDYDGNDYIVKGGWATVPGQTPDSDITSAIADACATRLLALTELNGTKLSSAN
ncbi:MAG: hypothetical protein ACREFL_10830 [Stellaceae bacterium]